MNSGRQETPIYRWVILLVTFLAQAAVGAPPAIFVLAVFFQGDLHLNKTQLGFLTSVFGIGIITSLLISGRITDILGIRRALVAGLSLTGLTILLLALMRSFAQGYLLNNPGEC